MFRLVENTRKGNSYKAYDQYSIILGMTMSR